MIRKTFLYLALIFSAVVLMSNRGGSPGGRSGSSTDGSTCGSNGGCHSNGSAPVAQEMLTSNIPTVGYSPDSTYVFTLSASFMSRDIYGFEIMGEDPSGTGVGQFITEPGINGTKVIRATHSFSSTNGNGSKTWQIQWKAPPKGTGDIDMYVAVLAANGNGNTGGDQVLVDTLSFAENLKASTELLTQQIKVYPNPTTDVLYCNDYYRFNRYRITAMDGKLVAEGTARHAIAVDHLKPGRYILAMDADQAVARVQFVVN